MPLNNAAMVDAANHLRSILLYMQTHSDDPGTSGTDNPTTAARQSVSWSAATADGDFGLAASVAFTGITPNGAVTWVTLWSALNGGTWWGNFQLTGDLTANADGEYTVTELDLNGSAS